MRGDIRFDNVTFRYAVETQSNGDEQLPANLR